MQINNGNLPVEALNEIARMRSLALLYLEAGNFPMVLATTATPASLGDIDSILYRLDVLYAMGKDAEGLELMKLAIPKQPMGKGERSLKKADLGAGEMGFSESLKDGKGLADAEVANKPRTVDKVDRGCFDKQSREINRRAAAAIYHWQAILRLESSPTYIPSRIRCLS